MQTVIETELDGTETVSETETVTGTGNENGTVSGSEIGKEKENEIVMLENGSVREKNAQLETVSGIEIETEIETVGTETRETRETGIETNATLETPETLETADPETLLLQLRPTAIVTIETVEMADPDCPSDFHLAEPVVTETPLVTAEVEITTVLPKTMPLTILRIQTPEAEEERERTRVVGTDEMEESMVVKTRATGMTNEDELANVIIINVLYCIFIYLNVLMLIFAIAMFDRNP